MGSIVNGKRGIELDNRELVFEYKLPRDFEKRQNEIPNRRTMGSKSERLLLPKYEKLKRIDGFSTVKETRAYDSWIKATMVLDGLSLPLNLRSEVLENANSFYKILGKHTPHRGVGVLIPVSIYITCLERFIFVRRRDYYSFCSEHLFNRCLKAILTKNRLLKEKLLSDDFRIKTILVQLSGLKEHFYLNGVIFERCKENLFNYFDDSKNWTNTAISGAIFDLTIHQLAGSFMLMSYVARFLGINQSTISRRRLY